MSVRGTGCARLFFRFVLLAVTAIACALPASAAVEQAKLAAYRMSFGGVAAGTSASQRVQLRNVGSTSFKVTGITLSGSSDFAVSGDCTENLQLAVNAFCMMNVTFRPTALGAETGSVTVTTTAGNTVSPLILAGAGIAPVTIRPVIFNYGNVALGNAVSKSFTLKNFEKQPLNISSLSGLGGDFSLDAANTNCPMLGGTVGGVVAAGASCVIAIKFAPTAKGAQSHTIYVNDNAWHSPQSFVVKGTGIMPVRLSPVAAAFAVQTVGTTSAPKTFTVTNLQPAALNHIVVSITGDGASDYSYDSTCPVSPASLPAGSACNVQVSFRPTTSGTRRAFLTISDDAVTSPQVATLTGSGRAPVTVMPALLNFSANVGRTSTYRLLTIANKDTVNPLTISDVQVSGDFAMTGILQTGSCTAGSPTAPPPYTISPGGTCQIKVSFSPKVGGILGGQIQIYDGAPTSPQVANLSGAASNPLTISPYSLSFSAQKQGTTSPVRAMTLTNHETQAETFTLSTMSSTTAGNDFSANSNCKTGVIAANSSCMVYVTIKPSTTGTITGKLIIWNSAASGSTPGGSWLLSANLSGSGTATNPAPAVTSVFPRAANPGDTIPVKITGNRSTNFSASSEITFATTAGTTTDPIPASITILPGSQVAVSSNEIDATLVIGNPSDIVYGARNITVTTPLAGGTTETALLTWAFVILNPNATWSVTGLSPDAGSQGTQYMDVSLTGSGTHWVQGTTHANFGQGIWVNSLQVTNATEAVANVSISDTAFTGPRLITMATGDEIAITSSADPFYVGPSRAALLTVSPNSSDQGTIVPLTLTASGTHFQQGTTIVSFSGGSGVTADTVTVIDQTSATASVTVASNAAPGLYDVTVSTDGETATLANAFTVISTAPPSLEIDTSTLPSGYGGANYSTQLLSSGGTGTGINWSVASGVEQLTALNLSLSSGGLLSGTPPVSGGSATFDVQVTDSAENTATKSLSLTIHPGVTIGTTTLPAGYAGTEYSQPLSASGGTNSGFTWSVIADGGQLAGVGLSLSSDGTLSGSNPAQGSATFTVQAKDSALNSATATLSVTVNQGLSINGPTMLPEGVQGNNYSQQLTTTGGTGTGLNWSVVQFDQPLLAALNLSLSSSGVLSGLNPNAGSTSFGVNVTDSANNFANSVFTVTINQPLTIDSGPQLPSGTFGTPYNQQLNYSGGSGSGIAWTVTSGSDLLSALGLTLSSDGVLSGSNPAAGSATFGVQVTDSLNDLATASLSVTIYDYSNQFVSGKINLNEFCGNWNSITLPTFTLTLTNINNSQNSYVVQSSGDGNFTIQDVPNGTYTLTPSMVGENLPEYHFYPSQIANIVVNDDAPGNNNFAVTLGYTVSGTMNYSGITQSGPIYLQLRNNTCGASNGTVISEPGDFTIHGVNPGGYTLNAWRDNIGYGQPNPSNPSGSVSGVSVPANGDLSDVSVTMNDPSAVTLSGSPSLNAGGGWANGVLLAYSPISNNGVETPASYTVQWSTTATTDVSGAFPSDSVAGSASFPATGDSGANIWILSTANYNLASSASYYFQARGVTSGSTSDWSSVIGPIALVDSSGSYAVSGLVSWNGTATATGPIYVGLYNPNTGEVFVNEVDSPSSGAPYSIGVPSSGNYGIFAVVDNDNDGMVDAGDFNDLTSNGPSMITIDSNSGSRDLSLQATSSVATVTTQYFHTIQSDLTTNDSYNLQFNVEGVVKTPVYVQLQSGPNVIQLVDMEPCGSDCRQSEFQLMDNIMMDVPSLTDTYSFYVLYSDGSHETITATPSPWNNGGSVVNASDLATLIAPQGDNNSDTPSFNWTYPDGDSGYSYQFSVCCSTNGMIWNIQGLDPSKGGFSSSDVTPPLEWGVDPTDSGNTPSPSSLSAGSQFSWSVQTIDSAGNSAVAQANFRTASSGPLALPEPNPETLPSAQVNSPYNGTITATGGNPSYSWQVDGLSDGLNWSTDNNNQTLVISGTPTNTTGDNPVTFTVTVTDSLQNQVSQTYTITVESSPLSLPASQTGTTAVNTPFQMTLNASGGAGPYVWTVNNNTIGSSGTVIGDEISASSTGDNQLTFSGTPQSIETVQINVTVTDSNNATASQVYYINVVAAPAGNSSLSGNYSCFVEGYKDGDNGRLATLMNFTADGDGNISDGVFNKNGRSMSSATDGTFSGTYAVNYNGLMSLAMVPSSGSPTTRSYVFALTPTGTSAQQIGLVENDDGDFSPSGQHGSGVCYQTVSSAFTSDSIASNSFAFGIRGEDGAGTPKAVVGRFSTDSANNVNAEGSSDGMKVGATGVGHSLITGGSYSATSNIATNGTVNLSMGLCNQGSLSSCNTSNTTVRNYIGYIVDANRILMLETDTVSPSCGSSCGTTPSGLHAGEMRRQLANTPTSASGVSGQAVLYWQGWEYSSSASTTYGVSGYHSTVLQASGDGSGNLTVHKSYSDENGTYKSDELSGASVSLAFDGASNPGRATFNTGDTNYLYYYDTNSAFYLTGEGGGYLASGEMENQTATPAGATFANSDIAGSYMFYQAARPDPNDSANVGEATLTTDAADSFTGHMSEAGQGSFSWDQPFTSTAQWDSANNGATYGAYVVGDPANVSCIAVTNTRSVCTSQNDSNPYLMISQQ
jgi:hypothetical protein